MLVAKGAISETLKVWLTGMWSYGRGPDAAKLVRLSAVITIHYYIRTRASTQCLKKNKCTIQYNDFVGRVNIETLS